MVGTLLAITLLSAGGGASPVAATQIATVGLPASSDAAGAGPAAVTIAAQGTPGENSYDLNAPGVFFVAARTDPGTTTAIWEIEDSLGGVGICVWPAGGTTIFCSANIFTMTGHVHVHHDVIGTGISAAVYSDQQVGALINMIL